MDFQMYSLDNTLDKNHKTYSTELNVYHCSGLSCSFAIIYVITGTHFYNSLVKAPLFLNIFCLIHVLSSKVNEVHEFDQKKNKKLSMHVVCQISPRYT